MTPEIALTLAVVVGAVVPLFVSDRVRVDVVALLVALASSVAFATAIAQQSNLLVMGPGDCRFSDYARVGLPLSLVAMVVIVLGLWLLW